MSQKELKIRGRDPKRPVSFILKKKNPNFWLQLKGGVKDFRVVQILDNFVYNHCIQFHFQAKFLSFSQTQQFVWLLPLSYFKHILKTEEEKSCLRWCMRLV